MKSVRIASLALAFAMFGIAACGSQQQPAKKQNSAATASSPAQGISIGEGRLVLPAVPGNPGAVYFTLHNDSDSQVTLDGAEVEGAKMAMLHETSMVDGHTDMQDISTMNVPAGGELDFAPGARHVMAMDLDPALKPGGTTNVTLSFSGGKKETFPAEILAAGSAR